MSPRMLLVSLALACAGCSKEAPPPPASESTAIAAVSPPATSAQAAKGKLAPCDAYSLWFDGDWSGSPEENQAAFILRVKEWTPECRMTAIKSECVHRCDDVVSGMVIKAAATPVERTGLIQLRHDRNLESSKKGHALLDRMKKFSAYAQSILSTPRAASYSKPNATLQEKAEAIAAGNPCLVRMKKDFAEIDRMKKEIDGQLAQVPVGFAGLGAYLSYAKSCVDCSADRSMCQDMQAELKVTEENLAEHDKLIAEDKRALAAKAPAR